MLTFAFDDLDRCFADSLDAVAVIEPGSLTVLYANHAFSRQIEALHMATGVNPLCDWAQVQQAMDQCLEQNALASYEDTGLSVRFELLPVLLLQENETALQMLQCRVLPLVDRSKKSEQMYQAMLEYLPLNTWACSLKGEVFWMNRTSSRFTYGKDEVHDHTHSLYIQKIHPDDLQSTSIRFGTAMVEGHLEPFRYRLRDQHGQFQWFLITAQPVLDEQGNARFWVGNSINIEAFVQQERALENAHFLLQLENERLKDQLNEAQALIANVQKMDLVTHLAGGVAHDLNNMLFVMGMHLGTLGRKVGDPAVLDSISEVRNCIRKAARLSSQLSGFSGRLPQNAQPISVQKMVEDAQDLFQQAVGAEIELQTRIQAQLPNVLADRTYLENALINLLINARDAMDRRGTVQLAATQCICPKDGVEQTFVCLSVKDSGSGINPLMLSKVFEPFFTTKTPDKGTGLGLPMVKNFVESSGGFVRVESGQDGGCTVYLYLPVTQQEVSEGPAVLPEVEVGQGAVLLVEDDDAVRKAVSKALRGLGYSLIAAKNVDQALLLLEAGTRPDLILSDIRMPGKKTVMDLIGYVQGKPLQIPMIFITGYSAEIAIQEGLLAGHYPVLFKPFEMSELAQKMTEVMNVA